MNLSSSSKREARGTNVVRGLKLQRERIIGFGKGEKKALKVFRRKCESPEGDYLAKSDRDTRLGLEKDIERGPGLSSVCRDT